MRKLIVSLAAVGTVLAFATPASAQWQHRPDAGYADPGRFQSELQDIHAQMDAAGRSGRLTGREARDLRNDLRGTEQMIYRAGRNGIQPWQARTIQQRIERLRYELRRYADNDRGRGWRR